MEGFGDGGVWFGDGGGVAFSDDGGKPEYFFLFAVSTFFLEYLHSRSVTKAPWLRVVRNGP